MRVYIPATIAIVTTLNEDRVLFPLSGTAFAVTPALREAFTVADDDELAEVAMREAALASLRLLSTEEGARRKTRRVVIAADVPDAALTFRPELDHAVVKLAEPITMKDVASIHVDLEDAEPAVAAAIEVVDAADLGDEDAELTVGDAQDHDLAWYATQEIPFLLELF